MAQVLEFKLPDLGEGLTEAEIVRWLVEVGDVVAIDQPVVEVETAKAMVEVPCPYGGVVTARFGEEGTELPVGSPLLTVAVGTPASDAGAETETETEGSGNVLVGYGTGAPQARRRRVRRLAADVVTSVADAPASAPAPAPAPETGGRDDGPVPVISPLVRRLARENGLELRELTGSGRDGLILRADVEQALRAAATQEATAQEATLLPPATLPPTTLPTPATTTTPTTDGVTRTPPRHPGSRRRQALPQSPGDPRRDLLGGRRRHGADACPRGDERRRWPQDLRTGTPRQDLHGRADPVPRAQLQRGHGGEEIVRFDRIHLGFAAQTERGLVVPVVKDAHVRDTEALSAEFARLTEAARTGTLTPGDLTGGTFTLNNYGVFGVDGSTPIINHPEAAMLGVGRIVPKPWVHEGELAVRQVVQLSLTFDHRVCDGGTAGGFLRYVADCAEQPAVLLRTL